MSYGLTPFEAPEGSEDWQTATVENILHRRIRFLDDRKALPMSAKILVKSLLSRAPDKRLGVSLEYGALMGHAWFRGVDWGRLERGEVRAPWVPDLAATHAQIQQQQQ